MFELTDLMSQLVFWNIIFLNSAVVFMEFGLFMSIAYDNHVYLIKSKKYHNIVINKLRPYVLAAILFLGALLIYINYIHGAYIGVSDWSSDVALNCSIIGMIFMFIHTIVLATEQKMYSKEKGFSVIYFKIRLSLIISVYTILILAVVVSTVLNYLI